MQDEPVAGEERIIAEFMAPLAAGYPGAFGLRDDCAVASPSPGCELVLKTDAIAEGVHFVPHDAAEDVGWKALAVNVSDLAAKGARPIGYLLSLAFPVAPAREWLAGFTRGLAAAQSAFGMHLMGGDTDRRPGPVSITPTVLGEVPVGRMVRRAAARVGDVLYVSGTLGDAGLGLRLRSDATLAATWGLAEADTVFLERRYLRPSPRLALRSALLDHAGAAMDLSDGLLKDLGRMCRASGVGARLEQAALPVSPAFAAVRTRAPDVAAAVLFAGDDYEVLCAVRPEQGAAFETVARRDGTPVTRIGIVTAGSSVDLVDADGAVVAAGTTGWDHF